MQLTRPQNLEATQVGQTATPSAEYEEEAFLTKKTPKKVSRWGPNPIRVPPPLRLLMTPFSLGPSSYI